MDTIKTLLRQWLETVSNGPPDPDREFIRGGATVTSVFRMAGALQRRLDACGEQVRQVCLCTADRALAAAAILASLDGRTQLVLPHASSPAALAALYGLFPFSAAIIDDAGAIPAGVADISPAAIDPASGGPLINIAAGADWVRLFTGGSTGAPRLWPKSPLNLLGEALFQSRHHGIGPADVVLATVSPLHIYGLLFSVIVPLVSSAAVVPGTPVFPAEIADAADRFDATVLVSVPAHYRALAAGPAFGATLKTAFSSAGALAPEDGAAFTQRTSAPVVEVYGSTETGGIATRCRAVGETAYTPFPVIDWRIDDDRLSVRSAFLSATLPVDANGYFQTADRVTPSGHGGFILGGRTDGVVKVGGKRVDLHAVHEALMAAPGVANACVLSLPTDSGRETDIAAMVETSLGRASILAHLAGLLEPQEIPRRVYTIERIPMTDAGKVDRAAVMRLMSDSA
ncbi:MAG: fatty acid--CoA ligase family protein [Pseudomonadota bacterium]